MKRLKWSYGGLRTPLPSPGSPVTAVKKLKVSYRRATSATTVHGFPGDGGEDVGELVDVDGDLTLV